MKPALQIAMDNVTAWPERSFDEKVRLYYFTFSEAVSLLKSSNWRLTSMLGNGRYGEVKRNETWMIPPDMIERLHEDMRNSDE